MTKASLAAQYRLFLLALVGFITLATTIPTRAAERPNVIFILADDKYVPDAVKPRKCPDLRCFLQYSGECRLEEDSVIFSSIRGN